MTDHAYMRLWRTTPFRLTVIYGGVFAVGVMALVTLIYVSAAGYLTTQMDQIVLGQAKGLSAGQADTLPDLTETLVSLHLAVLAARPWPAGAD